MAEEVVGREAQERQIQVHVDTAGMETLYANAFQTNATPEEFLISFGINQALPQQAEDQPAQVLLKLEKRMVLNPYTAKRLAIQLSQLVRQHEQQFGALELDITKRLNLPETPTSPVTAETETTTE